MQTNVTRTGAPVTDAQQRLWEAFNRLAEAAPADLWPLIDDLSAAAQAAIEDERKKVGDER